MRLYVAFCIALLLNHSSSEILESFFALEPRILNDTWTWLIQLYPMKWKLGCLKALTSIGIRWEVGRPLDKRATLFLAGRYWKATNGWDDARVSESRRRWYDRIGYIVINGLACKEHQSAVEFWSTRAAYGVLLLLHLLHSPILERPFDDVCLWVGTFDMLAFVELRPESMKVL